MRLTKYFLDKAHDIAVRNIQNAISTNHQVCIDFFFKNPDILTKASHVAVDENIIDNRIQTLTEDINTLKGVINQIQDPKLHTNLVQECDSFRNRYFVADTEKYRYARPFNLFMNINLNEDDIYSFKINTRTLSQSLSKTISQTYEKANIAPPYNDYTFYNWLKDIGGFFTPLKEYVQDISGYYSSVTTIDIELDKPTPLLTEKQIKEFKTLLLQHLKLDNILKTVKRHRGDWMRHTTLAKAQEDQVVWPLINKHTFVTDWIEETQKEIDNRKRQKEEELRRKREAEAARRKAQLEAIQKGEPIDTTLLSTKNDTPKIDRSDANLIHAINRLGDNK